MILRSSTTRLKRLGEPDILSNLQSASRADVDTTLGTFTITGSDVTGPPGIGAFLVRLIRPRIRVSLAGNQIATIDNPYGPPEEGLPLGLVLFAGTGLILFATFAAGVAAGKRKR